MCPAARITDPTTGARQMHVHTAGAVRSAREVSTMDQYDVIGQLYERIKTLPVGLAEQGTLFAVLPDLKGKSVLDVGTGTGWYPRQYKAMGASEVVGVDASTE